MSQQTTKSYFFDEPNQHFSRDLPSYSALPIIEPAVVTQIVEYPWFHRELVDPFNKAVIKSGGKPEVHVLSGNPPSNRLMPEYDPHKRTYGFGPYVYLQNTF